MIAVEREPVHAVDDSLRLWPARVGEQARLQVLHDGQSREVLVTLEPMP